MWRRPPKAGAGRLAGPVLLGKAWGWEWGSRGRGRTEPRCSPDPGKLLASAWEGWPRALPRV